MGRPPKTEYVAKGGFRRGAKVKIGKNKYLDGREYHVALTSGVDNSDMADLFCLPPGGCSRRLFYKKTSVAPDFPVQTFSIKPYLDLIEPLYSAQTQRVSRKPSRDYRHRSHKFIIAHLDISLIMSKKATSIPTAVKMVSTAEYLKIKCTGLPEPWLLEAQQLIAVRESPWACVIVWCPFEAEILSFDLAKDDAVINEIVSTAKDFWVCVEKQEAPPKFDVTDNRCFQCGWRITCQGVEYRRVKTEQTINDVALRMAFLENEAQVVKEAQKLLQNEALKVMGGQHQVDSVLGMIDATTRKQIKLDTAKMLKAHPELKKEYGKAVPVKEPKLVRWNKGE